MSERPTPETSQKMRDLLKHDIEHRAMVMAAWAMQLERERDEALAALQSLANVIDEMGDMPDAWISPGAWMALDCERKLETARALLARVEAEK